MDRLSVVHKSHRADQFLNIENFEYRNAVLFGIQNMLLADVSVLGDISSYAVLDPDREVECMICVQECALLAGMEEVVFFLEQEKIHDRKSGRTLFFAAKDGSKVKKGDYVLHFSTNIMQAMRVERVILNLLQRMTAIATRTSELMALIPKTVLLCPTRKSLTPLFDKKACVVAGGGSHRLNLSDAILIKDNHLEALAYDWDNVFQRISAFLDSTAVDVRFMEIEVESMKDALACITAGVGLITKWRKKVPFFLLLDNMSPVWVKKVVTVVGQRFPGVPVFFEASGGISEKLLPMYGRSGVDVLSMGALTNDVRAIDMSMSIALPGKGSKKGHS